MGGSQNVSKAVKLVNDIISANNASIDSSYCECTDNNNGNIVSTAATPVAHNVRQAPSVVVLDCPAAQVGLLIGTDGASLKQIQVTRGIQYKLYYCLIRKYSFVVSEWCSYIS